jgi:hypothetical protein
MDVEYKLIIDEYNYLKIYGDCYLSLDYGEMKTKDDIKKALNDFIDNYIEM